MIAKNNSDLAELNEGLFDLIATMPSSRTELVDFYFKHAVDDYVRSIQMAPGRKILAVTGSSEEAASVIRRAMIAADIVTFNVDSYIKPSTFGLVPIPSGIKSPIIRTIVVWSESTRIDIADSSEPAQLLGMRWNEEGSPGWERTNFFWTSDSTVNAVGGRSGFAGGPIHVRIPSQDNLLAEAEPLMRSGRLVFAPFICSGPAAPVSSELVSKSDLLHSSLLAPPSPRRPSSMDPLLDLEIPYLENIPLPTLAKVLHDEEDSLAMFRRKLDRLIEDVATAEGVEGRTRVLKFKREELEDELDNVRRKCDKVSRMKTLTRIGAYVGVAFLSIAGIYGLAAPSLIAGSSGPIASLVNGLYSAYETKREARRSSMYFVWRLSNYAPR